MSRGGKEREDYGPASAGVRNRVSVLVRNIPLNYTSEDLKAKFEKYGELRDVYIPRDYYTQRSRGFGFIEFRDARDADEAIYRMDRTTLEGREINVCLSKEGRKTPREMMIIETKQPGGRSGSYGSGDHDRRDRRRSRSPRRGGGRYSRSRSRSPRRGGGGGRHSRSRSPRGRDNDRERDRDYDRDYGRDSGRYNRDYDRDYDRGGRGGGDREQREYRRSSRSRSPRGEREPERERSPREASPRDDRDGVAQRASPPPAVDEEPRAADADQQVNDYY